MKLIFLDIDGVLNNEKTESRSPEGYIGISNGLLDKFYHLAKETGARIVLSSSWRRAVVDNELDGLWLIRKFRQKGLSFYSTTGFEGINRGIEIRKWLEEHKDLDIEEYAIIDDEFVSMFRDEKYNDESLIEHLIHTDSSKGLTNDLCNRALELLNNKKLITKEEYQPWIDEWEGTTGHYGKGL